MVHHGKYMVHGIKKINKVIRMSLIESNRKLMLEICICMTKQWFVICHECINLLPGTYKFV